MNRTVKPVFTALAAACLTWAANAAAPSPASPYAGEQARSIKALSDRDVAGLLDGQGAGFAKAAELNGYPGPAHTLELREPLGLSAEQAAATAALLSEHKAKARELGVALVDAERRLDALFALRRADVAAVTQATHEVALAQARLRAEHLNTHLAQTALLNAQQIGQYTQLRGYDAAPSPMPTPGTAPTPTPAAHGQQGHHGHSGGQGSAP